MATSRRAVRSASPVSATSSTSDALGEIDVGRLRAAGERDRRGGRGSAGPDRASSGRASDAASSLLIAAERADRRGADAGVRIAEHPPDLRHPLRGDVAARRRRARSSARARTSGDSW